MQKGTLEAGNELRKKIDYLNQILQKINNTEGKNGKINFHFWRDRFTSKDDYFNDSFSFYKIDDEPELTDFLTECAEDAIERIVRKIEKRIKELEKEFANLKD